MPHIVIRPVGVMLSPEVNEAFRSELCLAHLGDGTVFVGAADKQPDHFSVMWMVRDVPVLLAVPREQLSDVPRATVVARELVDRIQAQIATTITL